MAHRSKELLRAVEDELKRHGARIIDRGISGSGHQFVRYRLFADGPIQDIHFAFSPRSSATDFVRQKVRRHLRSAA